MIVVDSSVWISHFSDVRHPEVIRLRSATEPADILVGDAVLLEVLRGVRSERQAKLVEHELGLFTRARMLNEEIAVEAAGFYRQLRGNGVTIRSSIDLIIGTYCIVHGHALLQRDRDFLPMQQHLGLRLA